MNSKLLLAMFLGASAGLTAQNVNTQGPQAMRTKKNNFVHQAAAPAASAFSNRVEIWSNDLSIPADWIISNQSGNNDNWVIGNEVPNGSFPISPIASTSAANGYALFDSDSLCSGNQIADLTMANSADCSAFPAVVLEFQQNYRRFNDSTFVFVSNDGGTVWTKYTVNGEMSNNDSSPNPETVKVNITPTAGGQANVKVRFQFWSPNTHVATGGVGCSYAWMVDDVKLVTPPDFELLMTTLYHGDPVADWEYGTYPLSQVSAINVVAIVRNEGAVAQAATVNYTITRGATSVNSGASAEFTIQPFTSDTIVIPSGYTPDVTGSYTVDASVTSANTDSDPSNNAGTSDFSISDFVYSGLSSLTGAVAFTYSSTTAAPFEPSKIAHRYSIINDVNVKAIDIAVSSASTDDTDLIIELFDDADLTAPLAVGDFRITSTHPTSAQYFTILIDQQSLVAGGLYVASMGSEATDKRFLFYGVEGDADNAALVNVPDDNGILTWFLSDVTAAVNLNFDPSVGIADVNAPAVNMDVYPNPANNQISWKVKSQEASSVTVSLVDINGKVVFNKSISGKVVSYQDTLSIAEFANGVYTLQVVTNNGTTSQKVVIAH